AELRVDGGATANNFLMQAQADILGSAVVRPRLLESTAAGAAFLAGLACGYWESEEELMGVTSSASARFEPRMDSELREARYRGWRRAVERASHWELQ